jgi:NADPH-dependent ferric siderophore reductase
MKQVVLKMVLLSIGCLALIGCKQAIINEPDAFLSSIHVEVTEQKHQDHPMWREYTLILTDNNGKRVDVDEITMTLDMVGMNHSIEDTLQRVSLGEYHVLNQDIAMAGQWYSKFYVVHDQHQLVVTYK